MLRILVISMINHSARVMPANITKKANPEDLIRLFVQVLDSKMVEAALNQRVAIGLILKGKKSADLTFLNAEVYRST